MKSLPFNKDHVNEWLKTAETPFYVYDEKGLRECVAALNEAFSWEPNFREYFAVKACPNPTILRILESMGCGADCASMSEIELAKASGMTGEKIMFSSNETTDAEYQAAVAAGAIINLDDISQIDNLRRATGIPETICARYNPGEFRISNSIIGDLHDSKFGMTKDQLFEAFAQLKEEGVKNFGIHAMLASCSLENIYYPMLAEELFGLVLEMKEKLGIEIKFIDMSGGIGIPYTPDQEPVDIKYVGEEVRKVYERKLVANGLSPAIQTELGRYITGPHGYLVSKVIGHKNIYKNYIGLDATACDHMRPAMYGAYHHITVVGKEDAPCDHVYDVVGSLCENNDKFAVDRNLPEIEEGDILVLHDSGAHSRAMGYNYNGKPRCAEYLLKEDGQLKMIRRRESIKDLFATLDVDEEFTERWKG
ncbi:MAG: diaminopimelate decarboxylase [Firmicutes bacterium]|nr:diaminopimelate decarboxylase [Bacillota bacterium]